MTDKKLIYEMKALYDLINDIDETHDSKKWINKESALMKTESIIKELKSELAKKPNTSEVNLPIKRVTKRFKIEFEEETAPSYWETRYYECEAKTEENAVKKWKLEYFEEVVNIIKVNVL